MRIGKGAKVFLWVARRCFVFADEWLWIALMRDMLLKEQHEALAVTAIVGTIANYVIAYRHFWRWEKAAELTMSRERVAERLKSEYRPVLGYDPMEDTYKYGPPDLKQAKASLGGTKVQGTEELTDRWRFHLKGCPCARCAS